MFLVLLLLLAGAPPEHLGANETRHAVLLSVDDQTSRGLHGARVVPVLSARLSEAAERRVGLAADGALEAMAAGEFRAHILPAAVHTLRQLRAPPEALLVSVLLPLLARYDRHERVIVGVVAVLTLVAEDALGILARALALALTAELERRRHRGRRRLTPLRAARQAAV